MGQNFFEQPKSEAELTMEQADALLKDIRTYTAGLFRRERELENKIASFGGKGTLVAEYEELRHDGSWWRGFEEDLENRNFESVVMR